MPRQRPDTALSVKVTIINFGGSLATVLDLRTDCFKPPSGRLLNVCHWGCNMNPWVGYPMGPFPTFYPPPHPRSGCRKVPHSNLGLTGHHCTELMLLTAHQKTPILFPFSSHLSRPNRFRTPPRLSEPDTVTVTVLDASTPSKRWSRMAEHCQPVVSSLSCSAI